MAICEQCGVEVQPGDKVTEEIGGVFRHFCSVAHMRAFISGEQEAPAPEKPIEKMTKAELEAHAQANGITLPPGATKKTIVAVLTQLRKAASSAEPAPPEVPEEE